MIRGKKKFQIRIILYIVMFFYFSKFKFLMRRIYLSTPLLQILTN